VGFSFGSGLNGIRGDTNLISGCSLMNHGMRPRNSRVHKYRLREVGDFVGLECSTISIIANRTAEAGKTPRMKV